MSDSPKTFAVSAQLKKVCLIFGLLATVLLAIAVWLAFSHKATMLPAEFDVFHAINTLPDKLRTIMLIATYLGSVWAFAAAVLTATAFKAYLLAWWLSFSTLCVYGGAFVLKTVVHRPRPGGLTNDLIVRAHETGYGFVSAHTALATTLALTVFFYVPKPWRYVVVPLWIGIVGLSRLYLGVHSPLDIVGGVALGTIVFCVLRLLPESLRSVLRLTAADVPAAPAEPRKRS